MFDRMKGWWRGVRNWMADLFGLRSVTRRNIAINDATGSAIRLWMNMYTGNSPWLTDEVVSMNIPSFVAAELSRLTTIEMVSEVSGSARADYLNEQYKPVVDRARLFTEYAAAGGSVALKPYLSDGKILVDVVKAGWFFPTSFDATAVVDGCVFLDRITIGDAVFTRVEEQAMETEGCRITNKVYKSTAAGDDLGEEVPLSSVDRWAGLQPDVLLKGIDRPLFTILKMPFANSIDPNSPMGVSAYSRAVDLIKEADLQFSRLLWEMESGNRAMYVDLRAFGADEADPGTLPFKRFYRMLDIDPTTKDGEMFKEWSPALRVQEHIHALNEILQKVEDACGLARGSISEAPESSAGGAKTATELKIMRQRTYATIRDTQKAVEIALRDLLDAMDIWATIAGVPRGEYDVVFEFDDSVVTDRDADFADRQRLVAMGAMQPWEVRAWYLGEPEEVAKQNVQPTMDAGTWFPSVE